MERTPDWRIGWAAALWLAASSVASADPWASPGDISLRSDLQLLADHGLVRTPTTSWPLSWADVARDLDAIRPGDVIDPNLDEAYRRLRAVSRRETRVDSPRASFEAALAQHPSSVRGFDDLPREEGEVATSVDWTGYRFATRLQIKGVTSASDGQTVRFDGSYVGVTLGNLMVSVGYMDKWWGPGWAGSLILSNNARPIPSLTIERNLSTPFRVPILKWLGPWRASFQAGRLERSRTDFPRAHFMALRLTARPARRLELGVSRTAQLCGDGRRCTARTYGDMILGRDNDQPLLRQPGNQLAGFDVRWVPSLRLRVATYAQLIGEDEANRFPSKYLGLSGLESWGQIGSFSVRGYAEYARTSCDFAGSRPQLGCAYENGVYTDGYRYKGRSIGHAWDRDSKGWTIGFIATGSKASLVLRGYEAKLNELRGGSRHSLAPDGASLRGAEAVLTARTRGGLVRFGVGYDGVTGTDVRIARGAKAFVEWRIET